MKAVATKSYGSIDQLEVMEVPDLQPGAGEVRIRVETSAVNPSDYKVPTGQAKMLHARKFPLVMGNDYSGTVDAVGPGVDDLKVGDEVFGFLHFSPKTKSGAFGQQIVLPAKVVARKPANVSHAQAAAAGTSAITALQAIRNDGHFKSGGKVLIIGASGGVGSLAIGVVKKLGGQVTAVCATHAVEFVRALGADEVIDRKKQDWLREAKGPFAVVFDAAAASSWSACKHLLAEGGSYVTTLPSAQFFQDRLASVFSSTRARLVMVKPVRADLELVAKWIGEGMKVPIESTVPVREVKSAIARQHHGEMRGRIVVDVAHGF